MEDQWPSWMPYWIYMLSIGPTTFFYSFGGAPGAGGKGGGGPGGGGGGGHVARAWDLRPGLGLGGSGPVGRFALLDW